MHTLFTLASSLPTEGSGILTHKGGTRPELGEDHPSGSSLHLEDVGLSWDSVVHTIDGEDNRGQGTDHKT